MLYQRSPSLGEGVVGAVVPIDTADQPVPAPTSIHPVLVNTLTLLVMLFKYKSPIRGFAGSVAKLTVFKETNLFTDI